MDSRDSRIQMDLSVTHEYLSAVLNDVRRQPPKSVFDQEFQHPDPQQVNACLHWLEMVASLQAATGNAGKPTRVRFYQLKHLVEDSAGLYITTDAAACAALAGPYVAPRLRFKLPRNKDVKVWGVTTTVPVLNLLSHIAGRNLTDDTMRLGMAWSTLPLDQVQNEADLKVLDRVEHQLAYQQGDH